MSKFKKILAQINSEEPLPVSIQKMIDIYEGFDELTQSPEHSDNEDLRAKMRITDKLICEALDELLDASEEEKSNSYETSIEGQDEPVKKSMVKIIEELYTRHGKDQVYTIEQLKNVGLQIDFNAAKIRIGTYLLCRPILAVRKVFTIVKK